MGEREQRAPERGEAGDGPQQEQGDATRGAVENLGPGLMGWKIQRRMQRKAAQAGEEVHALLDPTRRREAEQFNRGHLANVVKFDRATHGSYAMRTGQLDAERVAGFQKERGLTPTGKVDEDTVAVAQGREPQHKVDPPPHPDPDPRKAPPDPDELKDDPGRGRRPSRRTSRHR